MINNNKPYQVKEFNLSGLNGISDQTLDLHFKPLRRICQRDQLFDGENIGVLQGW